MTADPQPTLARPMPADEQGGLLGTIEEVVGLGTYVWEPAKRLVLWSAGFYRMLMLPAEPVSSHVFFERVHPEDRARIVMASQATFARRRVDPVEYRLLLPDQSIRWVIGRGTVTLASDGTIQRVVGTIVDVTEQHLAADRLAESNQLLAESQRAAGVGTYSFDMTTGRLEWSDEMYRIVGLVPGTPIDGATAVAQVHPEDRARQADYGRRVMAGEQLPPLLVRVVRPDGVVVHMETRARTIAGPNGPRRVGVSMDVTARVELERQLRHAVTMDAIGTLAAGIAHDFNNYLTVLALQVESIRAGKRQGSPAELESMAGAIDHCSGLVRQLLTFARQHPFRPTQLDLTARVAGVVDLFRRLIGPEIEIVVSGAGPLLIEGDGTQLDAALMNLLVNARDAMTAGGRVTIELSADAGFARIRIADAGVGIPAEILPRIFEPYFTTKAEGRGVGLGLAAVYGTVRQHGGSIDVTSEPGRGTTFELRLPLSTQPAAAAVTAVPTAMATLRILLVEDVEIVRTVLEAMLVDEGHQVVTAVDGVDALAKVRGGAAIDVVLSDVVMPRMTGTELARILAVERPELPVIRMSGHAGQDHDDGNVHLDKPFSRDQLLAALARVIS